MAVTLEYLSEEWFDAARAAVAATTTFGEVGDLRVGQRILRPDGSVLDYQLLVSGGHARLEVGAAEGCEIAFSQSFDTARLIASGEINAQEAFLRGEIRITGDPQRLIDAQPAFSALAAALAPLRSRTHFPTIIP